ncbi:hypothetical protein V8C86DRAFT_3128662 [Haematococcus lacustris]
MEPAALPPGFPAGLRVLVVDDDGLCLKVVQAMLQKCGYTATGCIDGGSALALLRSRPADFDLVLSDVYMPDMNGFALLEVIGLELDLPIVMMSSNGETSTVLRGVTHGAVDFLIKPVRIEELRNLWQHVVRRRRDLNKDAESEEHSVDDQESGARKRKECSTQGDATTQEQPRGGQAFEEEGSASKKARVVWSVEMHQRFVTAVNQLGVDKAVPKKILEIMSAEGLTRENVASHLQKYRLYLRRVQQAGKHGSSPHPGHTPHASQAGAAGGGGAGAGAQLSSHRSPKGPAECRANSARSSVATPLLLGSVEQLGGGSQGAGAGPSSAGGQGLVAGGPTGVEAAQAGALAPRPSLHTSSSNAVESLAVSGSGGSGNMGDLPGSLQPQGSGVHAVTGAGTAAGPLTSTASVAAVGLLGAMAPSFGGAQAPLPAVAPAAAPAPCLATGGAGSSPGGDARLGQAPPSTPSSQGVRVSAEPLSGGPAGGQGGSMGGSTVGLLGCGVPQPGLLCPGGMYAGGLPPGGQGLPAVMRPGQPGLLGAQDIAQGMAGMQGGMGLAGMGTPGMGLLPGMANGFGPGLGNGLHPCFSTSQGGLAPLLGMGPMNMLPGEPSPA